jgi:lactobin A/cerein 7B family class IIb bacteriocin
MSKEGLVRALNEEEVDAVAGGMAPLIAGMILGGGAVIAGALTYAAVQDYLSTPTPT